MRCIHDSMTVAGINFCILNQTNYNFDYLSRILPEFLFNKFIKAILRIFACTKEPYIPLHACFTSILLCLNRASYIVSL
jgi:hypothetical protein